MEPTKENPERELQVSAANIKIDNSQKTAKQSVEAPVVANEKQDSQTTAPVSDPADIKIHPVKDENKPSATRGLNLLKALWRSPDKAHQLATLDRKTGRFNNEPLSNISDIQKQIQRLSDRQVDLYFACAEYETPDNRTAANASGAFGFWMDVDCGVDKAATGKGYDSIASARKAQVKFCRLAKLPEPNFIINSGSGLHIYWVGDVFIPKDQWQLTANKLKALTKQFGFLADDSRTADIASVLRIPGTLNHKTDPAKSVEVIHG